MKNFKLFLKYFGDNKKLFPIYIILSFIAGLLELCGLALIYPFALNILSSNTSNLKHTFFIGCLIIMSFLLKNVFMIFYVFIQTKFSKIIETEMILKFMKFFIFAPFSMSSKIPLYEKNQIFGQIIANVINNYIFRISNLIVNILSFIIISSLLIYKFPLACFVAISLSTLLIIIQNNYFKPLLKKLSDKINNLLLATGKYTNDILLNTKGIKVSRNEIFFYENYKNSITETYRQMNKSVFFNTIPPYIVEPFILIFLAILLTIISLKTYNTQDRMLASYALIISAMFRLAPLVARIQVNLNGISTAMPYLDLVLKYASEFDLLNINIPEQTNTEKLKESIELKNVSFGYKNSQTILNNINLKINKGDFVGIVGASGIGKTTLVDLITGLYKPQNGEILIDGTINTNLNISYIPQNFYLINSSIRENVAFGHKNIDDCRVKEALNMADLLSFIETNLPDGIYSNPFVDSLGLSEGQKQRLVIARALYNDADVLIMDEATSSLDLKTEDKICNVLNKIKREKTIITIAHRLSTIKSADKIIYLQDDKTIVMGTFEELYYSNTYFKELVDITSINQLQ